MSGGLERDDLLRRGDGELGEQVPLRLGQLGALPEGAGRAGEGAHVQAVQVAADVVPGVAGGGLDDPDEQQRQPAQDDVGADAFFEPVAGGPQVDDLFHVPPAAFDFQELLVAQRDVLGGQVRVAAAQQVLAVEVFLGLDRGLAGAEQPAGVTRRYRFSPGLAEILPRSSPRLTAGSASEPSISSSSCATIWARRWASRSAASGLKQITNRSWSLIRTSLIRMFAAISV